MSAGRGAQRDASAAGTGARWRDGASRQGIPFLWCGSVVSALLWLPVVPFTGGVGTDDVIGFLLGIGVSAVLHVGYMLVLQRGYAAGDLSTVYAVARGTGPLLTVAVAVLGERPSALALVGVAVVIVGVLGIGIADRSGARRSGSRAAIAFGLFTGVAIAAYTLWDAASLRTWSISPVAFMVGCVLLEVPRFTLLLGRRLPAVVPIARREWRRLLAFGVLSPLSYILVLAATTIAPVALVAIAAAGRADAVRIAVDPRSDR